MLRCITFCDLVPRLDRVVLEETVADVLNAQQSILELAIILDVEELPRQVAQNVGLDPSRV